MDKLKNIKVLEKVYVNLDKLIDNYADLPETEESERKFWEYAEKNIFQSKKNVKERELESVLYDVAYFSEKQGFIYGFNYALELIGRPDLLKTVVKGIVDELPEHK